MAGRKPSGSRFKRAFVIAAAFLGLGAGTKTLDKHPKKTDTDTTPSTTRGTRLQAAGINVSPSDQFWKHTLSFKTDQQRADEMQAAASSGDSWRVQALFEHGVSPNSSTAIDALTTAAFMGHSDVVMTMMKNGVDPTANNNDALIWAVRGGNVDVALRLMNLGADANAQNGDALVIAAMRGDQGMTDILLGRGADATAQDSYAYRIALDNGYTDIANSLSAKGASIAPVQPTTPDPGFTSGADPIGGLNLYGSTPFFKPMQPFKWTNPGPFSGPF